MVIVSHSFALYGNLPSEWLLKYSGGRSMISDFGLGGFFSLSGYLVFLSSQRSPNFGSFISKRILRIFPGLIICTLLASLVLGPLIARRADYFTDPKLYSFIWSNITVYDIKFFIPGVFESNPYPRAINGSLWTIGYEFLFYLFFIVFFLKKGLNTYLIKLTAPVILVLFFLFWKYPAMGYCLPGTGIMLRYLVLFGIWFLAGVLMANTEKYWKPYISHLAIISSLLVCLLIVFNLPVIYYFLPWTIFVITFGNCKTPIISKLDKVGDPSYGIYIYGFVLQQSLMYFFKMSFYAFLTSSIILSIVLGYLSWYLVEKKALKLKKRLSPTKQPLKA